MSHPHNPLIAFLIGSARICVGSCVLGGSGFGAVNTPRRRHLRVRLPTSGFPTPAAGGFGPRRYINARQASWKSDWRECLRRRLP